MKLEAFFEKFDLFAHGPGAVTKMRELVLELAVHGRLIPQDPKDEPAEAILASIAKQLGKTKIRKPTGGTDSESKEVKPFALPTGWVWARFPDLGAFARGKSKHRPRNDPSLFVGGTHRLVQTGDIARANGTIQTYTSLYNNFGLGQSRMWPAGTLCITIAANIADSGILGFDACFPDSVVGFIPARPIPSVRYFEYFVRTAKEHLEEFAPSTAQKNINLGILEQVWIPFPPLAEQKRIVAKVDELMALCDRLEAQQQERETRHATLACASLARFADAPTTANLDFLFHKSYTIRPADLRKSILTLAVQGKLVPQNPNDEPAEECLSRLGLKSTVVPQRDDSEDDSLPPAWTRVRFEDVALIAGGVTLGRKLGNRKSVTLPYLRVANVKRAEIDLSVIKEVSIAEDEIERYALRENDLLMTEGGDWDKVGRAAIWRAEIPVCLHQNHVFRARMRSVELTPFWFERYFNSPIGRGYFESASKQTTNLASINMRQVRSCPIPLPPLAEQRRIVAKVEQLMALVDELETQLAASRAAAANLLSALLAELTSL